MIETTIEIDESEIKRRLGVMSDQSGKVIARAVNRAFPTGKLAIARETKKRYKVVQKDINNSKTLKIIKAKASDPTAVLDYTGHHRNLYLWHNKRAVTPDVIIHWTHGVPNVPAYKAAVKRGHPRRTLKSSKGNNTPFIQRVNKDKKTEFVGLFRRKNSKRDSKLVGVEAPAIPQIIKNEEVMAQFRRATGPMLQKRLEHEIDVVLKGLVR